MRLLGLVLVVVGVLLLIYGGVTLIIPQDVVNLGSVSITIHENLVLPLPPILGLIFLIVGIVMVMSAPVGHPPPYE